MNTTNLSVSVMMCICFVETHFSILKNLAQEFYLLYKTVRY